MPAPRSEARWTFAAVAVLSLATAGLCCHDRLTSVGCETLARLSSLGGQKPPGSVPGPERILGPAAPEYGVAGVVGDVAGDDGESGDAMSDADWVCSATQAEE